MALAKAKYHWETSLTFDRHENQLVAGVSDMCHLENPETNREKGYCKSDLNTSIVVTLLI